MSRFSSTFTVSNDLLKKAMRLTASWLSIPPFWQILNDSLSPDSPCISPYLTLCLYYFLMLPFLFSFIQILHEGPLRSSSNSLMRLPLHHWELISLPQRKEESRLGVGRKKTNLALVLALCQVLADTIFNFSTTVQIKIITMCDMRILEKIKLIHGHRVKFNGGFKIQM